MEANVPLTPKRVRREIAKVLPGFASHTKFFSSFAGDFTPVAVNAADKRRLVSKIDQIKGLPEKEVRAVVRDWMGEHARHLSGLFAAGLLQSVQRGLV